MSTLIDLTRLYELWDCLTQTPVTSCATMLDAPFEHFPAGAPVEDVWHWFEAQNARFSVGDAQQGLRLQPLTACAHRAFVVDSAGKQVCVGDEIQAVVNVGRNGRMREVVAVVTDAHLPDGILNAVSTNATDRSASGVEAICVETVDAGRFALGREHHDIEHGFKERAHISRCAPASMPFTAPQRPRPKN